MNYICSCTISDIIEIISILFTIIFMATIPITLQSVLAAQNKVVTPSASPTAAANQAQLAANKAKAAERAAANQGISGSIAIPTTPEVDL